MLLNEEVKRIISNIAEVAQYAWEKGWAERNGGNVSVDITNAVINEGSGFEQFPKIAMKITTPKLSGHFFLVKTTGSRFRDLARQPEKNLIILRITNESDGYHILWGGKGPESRPTNELIPHLRIHEFLRNNNLAQKAVLHTHASYLIALTHMDDYGKDTCNRFLWSTHAGVKLFFPYGIGMATYQPGGSEELADATVRLLKKHRIVLWEKHGCIATGIDVFDAFDIIDGANKAAEVFLICKNAGYEPKKISKKQLTEMRKIQI